MSDKLIAAVMLDTLHKLTAEQAYERCPEWVNELIHITRYKWPADFAVARNYSLDVAARQGYKWAVVLDTDMRYVGRANGLIDELQRTDVDVIRLPAADGSYYIDRVFRLPRTSRFVGATHEAYDSTGQQIINLSAPRFADDPKSEVELKAKFERDKDMLEYAVKCDPNDARSWYYLGYTLSALKQYDDALNAYIYCISTSAWDEERAWSWYQIATMRFTLERYDRVISDCMRAITERADYGDAYWLASLAEFKLGNYWQAIRLARTSAHVSYNALHGKLGERIGFREVHGLWEGPFEVLEFCYRVLGDKNNAAAYAVAARMASERRKRLWSADTL